jgi:hypothetical protein
MAQLFASILTARRAACDPVASALLQYKWRQIDEEQIQADSTRVTSVEETPYSD